MVQLLSINFYTKSNNSFKHDDEKTIATSVISTEILNTENDLANKTKRKRDKELSDDDRLPVERHYFYDHLLN